MEISTTAQQSNTQSTNWVGRLRQRMQSTIRVRIMSTYGLLILLMLGTAAVMWFSYTAANNGGDQAITQQTAVAQLSVNAQFNLLNARAYEKSYLATAPESQLDAEAVQGQIINPFITNVAQIRQRGIELKLLLQQSGGTSEEIAQIDTLMASVDRYEADFLALVAAQQADPTSSVNSQLVSMDTAAQTISTILNTIGESSATRAITTWENSQLIGRLGATATIMLMVIISMISIFFALRLSRTLSGSFKQLTMMTGSYLDGGKPAPIDVFQQLGELQPLAQQMNKILTLEAERDAAADTAYEEVKSGLNAIGQTLRAAAQGQLSQEAESPFGITAELTAAINHLLDQWRQYVTDIHRAMGQLHKASGALHSTTQILADESHTQGNQLNTLSTTAEQLSATVTRIAKCTIESQKIGRTVYQQAGTGKQATQTSVASMERIRQQVQETAKHMKQLGERSQEMGEFRLAMQEIKEQISLLALNVSIKTRTEGSGMAQLKEQIGQLEAQANQSVSELAPTIAALQREASTVITAVEATTTEVVNGSKSIGQTSHALQEIEWAAEQLTSLVEKIAQDTKRQAKTAVQLTSQIKQLKQLLQTHTSHMEKLASATSGMARLVESVDQVTERFKLSDPS